MQRVEWLTMAFAVVAVPVEHGTLHRSLLRHEQLGSLCGERPTFSTEF